MGVRWGARSVSWVLLPFLLPFDSRWSSVRPRRYTDPMTTTKLRHAVVTLLLAPPIAFAWGYDGHRIVGDMASHYLTPEAGAAVKSLLGDQTMADVTKTKRGHYARVILGSDRFGLECDCPAAGCIVSAVKSCTAVSRLAMMMPRQQAGVHLADTLNMERP